MNKLSYFQRPSNSNVCYGCFGTASLRFSDLNVAMKAKWLQCRSKTPLQRINLLFRSRTSLTFLFQLRSTKVSGKVRSADPTICSQLQSDSKSQKTTRKIDSTISCFSIFQTDSFNFLWFSDFCCCFFCRIMLLFCCLSGFKTLCISR